MRTTTVMRKILAAFLIILGLASNSYADTPNTECASRVFADALAKTAGSVDETAHETTIQGWIYQTFALPDVLTAVLACPEIANTPDTETINFTQIQYTFPNGREIIINYKTQPKILKQRLSLANKRSIPTSDINPQIGGLDDESIWTNTEPAWYAIMVVQHGALDEFVGPDKNNTISLDYIKNNIDTLYPRGATCTDKSALANDNYAINRAVTQTVNLSERTGEEDSNDYYVAGDVNLQWISYLEIALDVVITVGTMGGSLLVTGATKSARASRVLKNLTTSIRDLSKLDSVRDYITATRNVDRLTDELKAIDATTDAVRYADKARDLDQARDAVRTLETSADVKKYQDARKTFTQLNAYRRGLRAIRSAQRGNIIARAARATRSTLTGNKLISHGAKLARSSKFSTRTRDWLFQSTLRNIGALGKLEATGGLIYGALTFIGGMYDWTETSTGDYTSGVDFAPLLLLSADDLSENGQENVVNHGMWLLWAGDSISAADDDAAYLQAMDFAAKFHQDLLDIQNDTSSPCDVDIFIVRPVLRNPGTENTELYYLIMNDKPWTTND